jgi:hypothetical protein
VSYDSRRKKNEQAGQQVESRTAKSLPISGTSSRGNPRRSEHGISNWNHDGLCGDLASCYGRGVSEVASDRGSSAVLKIFSKWSDCVLHIQPMMVIFNHQTRMSDASQPGEVKRKRVLR